MASDDKMASNVIFTSKPTAILVDGAFFLKRCRKCYKGGKSHDAEKVANNMYTMCLSHVTDENLYRILYYDCLPLDIKMNNPITNKTVDFSKTYTALFRLEFLKELKKKRKVNISSEKAFPNRQTLNLPALWNGNFR